MSQSMNRDVFIKNVPKVLLEKNEWLTWYNKPKNDGTFTKPPLFRHGHTVEEGTKGCSFKQALHDMKYIPEYGKDGGGVGFKLNDRHSFVFFDCDHVESIDKLPNEFKEFIMMQDTYMELSPSGKGLRIMFRCVDKDKLISGKGKVNLVGMDGELFVRSGYVTITGNQLSGEKIKDITTYQLEQWFIPKKAEVIDIPVDFNHPDISLVLGALKLCRLDQSDRVQKIYQSIMKQEYNHYDYWLRIMSACHNYASVTGQMNEMTSAVVEWSQTDEVSFESADDVVTHWSSLSNKPNNVTYKTLFNFAKLLRFQWPVEKYTAKGEPTGKPVPTDVLNMIALIEYHNLKFYWDIFSRSLYITGEKEIIDKYFMTTDVGIHFGMYGPFKEDTLNYAIISFAQQEGYTGIAVNSLLSLWKAYISGRIIKINSFKMWLETPPEELPEDMIEPNTDLSKSNLDYLMSCFTFKDSQNQDLARMYFDAFFYEITMPIYNIHNKYAERSFMIILTGPEACHKTTFCGMLFPANLSKQFVTMTTEILGGGKSDRDFKAQLVESVLVISDEVTSLLNKQNDAMLKNLITTSRLDYAVIYAKHTEKFDRNAAIIATTNKTNFSFEVDSNRRLAIIGVQWINTDMMEKINRHHFYRSYVAKGKKAMANGVYPWKLSNEIIKLQYQENEKYRSHTDLEILFRETFDFDAPCPDYDKCNPQLNTDLYGINQVKGALRQRHPEISFKASALGNELKRICGKYTNTVGKTIKLEHKGYIEDGIVKSGQWTKYVLPPLIRTDAFD